MIHYVYTYGDFNKKYEFFVVSDSKDQAIEKVVAYLSGGGWFQTGIAGRCYRVKEMKISSGIDLIRAGKRPVIHFLK